MKFLNLNRVLCISAHPDDTEYGALGSMIKFKDTQFDVVVLSNGGDFDESSGFNLFSIIISPAKIKLFSKEILS